MTNMITVLCFYRGNLVLCHGDDAMSGFYPNYDNAIVVVKNVDEIGMYGIMFDAFDCYKVVEDSWDGFQPVDLNFREQLKILKKFVSILPNDFSIDNYNMFDFCH